MKRIEIEMELIQIGIYCNIISDLINKYEQLSIIKISVFAYLIKKNKFIPNKVYTANNTQDIISKCISLLSGDYEEYCKSMKYIIKSMDILISANKLCVKNDLLIRNENTRVEKSIYVRDAFLENTIKSSNKISDRQFLKEVIQNV
ncbi:MAG: hypothetical protein KIC47_03400 [Clostridium sp.]|uniref:hypothetical protein n=1 Tax=Clostridium neonatale TaxID=137838 RepID=UPI001E0C5D59|nr:hypothetical protein [Clostridium neonatale]MBS5949355.1 hypothetical protein [Clostridium sp.]CAI3539571.1 conserved hypothetical protein [Clostridium neonatale]CAI3606497.1 conserved hypothetical protein [Clostridium neonatale]